MKKCRSIVYMVFLIFVFLTGCASNQKNGVNTGIKTVVIPKMGDAKIIDIISDLDYIILEERENSYFGHVSKLRVHQNKIYILDNTYANALFIFTIDGKHIATIGDQKGSGPFDFVKFSNFEIDYLNNQILTMDNFGWKFMIYDLEGNFVKRVNSDISISDAVLLPDDYILHAKSTCLNGFNKDNKQIIIVDKNKKIVSERFEYDDNKNLCIGITNGFIVSQFDGTFNFAPKYRDTIYTVSFNTITPKYAIDFGNNRKISKRTIDHLGSVDELEKLLEFGSTCFMGGHVESEDFLYLTLGYLNNRKYVVYNKQTNRAITLSCDAEKWEYIYELSKILCSDSDGYFYGAFNVAIDLNRFFNSLPGSPKINTIEERNPILFKYKIKM